MDRGLTVDSSRIERWRLRPGDHIYVWRKMPISDVGGMDRKFSHHGIYESDEKVIQLTPFPKKNCPRCHGAKRRGFFVVVSCLDCFLDGDGELCLFAYGVSKSFYDARNNPNKGDALAHIRQPTCSMDPEDPPGTVLRRANDLLDNGGIHSIYEPVHNNCFHFAFYCKTGRQYYGKVTLVLDVSAAHVLGNYLLPSDDDEPEFDVPIPNGSYKAARVVVPPAPPSPRRRSPEPARDVPPPPWRRLPEWLPEPGRVQLPQTNFVRPSLFDPTPRVFGRRETIFGSALVGSAAATTLFRMAPFFL